ncbi:MAG: mycofactocin-associated electron transfer flavoprotein alpha subunit [Actinomycetes bacterium]
MIAVLVIRHGVLPAGALEATSEANGNALVIGSNCLAAITELSPYAHHITMCEWGDFAPSAWAHALAPHLRQDPRIVLPASPDGRDFAAHLAQSLQRPLYASALRIGTITIELVRWSGQAVETLIASPEFVATLQVGVRSIEEAPGEVVITSLQIPENFTGNDAEVVEVLPPDAASIDLSEAPRIICGGAGIQTSSTFHTLFDIAEVLSASVGATRVITDRSWVEHQRQIGTTGVVVNPQLYIALGVSGAVQHTSGLGQPEHIVSINTDPHCPMMQLADLGIVSDANEVLPALLAALKQRKSNA